MADFVDTFKYHGIVVILADSVIRTNDEKVILSRIKLDVRKQVLSAPGLPEKTKGRKSQHHYFAGCVRKRWKKNNLRFQTKYKVFEEKKRRKQYISKNRLRKLKNI